MIGITIKGRLGNQMFQYAFIRALSIRFNSLFFMLCSSSDELMLGKYFNVGRNIQYILAVRFGKLLNFLLVRVNLRIKYENFELNRNQPDLDVLSDFTIYHGFFQTDKYYNQFISRLIEDFKVKRKYRRQFKKRYSNLSEKKILVLHLRRGDYKQFYIEDLKDQDFRLPLDYYLDCLHRIDNLDGYHVYVIGDEINIREDELPCEISIEKNEMIIDFQLMMEADTLIISNSSFAWWAAMLNKKQDKTIYAPKYWVGFKQKIEYPKGIMTPNWHWIDVQRDGKIHSRRDCS